MNACRRWLRAYRGPGTSCILIPSRMSPGPPPKPPQGGGRAGSNPPAPGSPPSRTPPPGTRAASPGTGLSSPTAPSGKPAQPAGSPSPAPAPRSSPAASAAVRALAAALKLPQPADFAGPGGAAGSPPTGTPPASGAGPGPAVVPASRKPPTSGGDPSPRAGGMVPPSSAVRQPPPGGEPARGSAPLVPRFGAGAVSPGPAGPLARPGATAPPAAPARPVQPAPPRPGIGTQAPGATKKPAAPAAALGENRKLPAPDRPPPSPAPDASGPVSLPGSGRFPAPARSRARRALLAGLLAGAVLLAAGAFLLAYRQVEFRREEAAGAGPGGRAGARKSTTLGIEYHADRNALRDSLLVGNRLLALGRAGNLLLFDRASFGLLGERQTRRSFVCIGPGDENSSYAALSNGAIVRVSLADLSLTRSVRLPGGRNGSAAEKLACWSPPATRAGFPMGRARAEDSRTNSRTWPTGENTPSTRRRASSSTAKTAFGLPAVATTAEPSCRSSIFRRAP